MVVAMRLAIWRVLAVCGVIHTIYHHSSVLAKNNVIKIDTFNMTCHLASGMEGICVFGYLCHNDVVNTDGHGIIDLRYLDECEDYYMKCCSKESPCMERAGTCLPKNKCGADLNISKYRKFKLTDECNWSGYQCCPNDYDQQVSNSTDTGKHDEEDSAECDNDSICVPDDQCLVSADGVNLIEARSSVCSSSTTCCPRSQIKKNSTSSCETIGGTCIREDLCEDPYDIDIRSERCTEPGFQCCRTDVESTTTRETSSEEKKCFNNMGVCTQKNECKNTVYKDRKNECDGLTCCGSSRPTTTTSTTERPDDDTDSPPSESTNTCESLGGTCEAENNCQRKAQQSADCAVDSVCCLSKGSREVPTGSAEDSDVKECGFRNEYGIKFDTINRNDGESQYGEFPWMVAILLNDTGNLKLKCGGTLIDPEVVLTTAECAKAFRRNPENLIIRAGEWDMGTTMEPIPYKERRVAKIKAHKAFNPTTLINNVALLFLEDKFDRSATINTVCLPPQGFTIDNGDVTATGWGTTPQNRTKYQQILKSIDLQYSQRADCERILKAATRNKQFKLHSSFICAGGVVGKDTCRGDAGSPVIYTIPDDENTRYYAVGMVSWGVGCGKPGTPSVYTDIGKFREWIDGEMEKEGLSTHYYDYQPEN